MSGSITMTSGSISWNGVNAPTAAQVGARANTWMPTAAQVGARPDTWLPTLSQLNPGQLAYLNSINSTHIGANAIQTSHIASRQIQAIHIQAGAITANEISANYIYAGKINANQINAGTITGFTINGSTINWAGVGSLSQTTGHDGTSTTNLILINSSQGIRISCTRGMNLEAGGGIWIGSAVNINTKWGHQNLRTLIERLYTHLNINP